MADIRDLAEAAPAAAATLHTVIYSHGRDLYRVVPYDAAKKMWLSVASFPPPLPPPTAPRMPYLGPVSCGNCWRKAYSVDWSVVQPGLTTTLPATDPLVVDYAAAESRNG